mmetsp:Transcript_112037/g.349158  ORF Transcript_112037/g.349158 Transcript_112037/m.349158 type:complete len:203 (+) Transcript_112037:763-1371(+)
MVLSSRKRAAVRSNLAISRRRAAARLDVLEGAIAGTPPQARPSHQARCSSSLSRSASRSASSHTAAPRCAASGRSGVSVSSVLRLESERQHSSASSPAAGDGPARRRRRGVWQRDCGGEHAGEVPWDCPGEDATEGVSPCNTLPSSDEARRQPPSDVMPRAVKGAGTPSDVARRRAGPLASECVALRSPRGALRSNLRKRTA